MKQVHKIIDKDSLVIKLMDCYIWSYHEDLKV